jgi:hypothetical protein
MRISIALTIVLAFALPKAAAAKERQDLEGGTGRVRIPAERQPSAPASAPKVRTVTSVRVVPVIRTIKVTPTTGTLSVATESLTDIFIEPLSKGKTRRRAKTLQGTVPNGERVFVFNDLQPGRYTVRAELKGYQPANKEVVIFANKPSSMTLNLVPITYNVTIETNVSQGEVRYKTKDELPQIVPLRNSRVVLSDLRPGKYDIDIRSEELGYQTLLGTIEVGEGKTSFKAELKRQLSKETFSAVWSYLEGWDAPDAWHIVSRRLLVNGRGVALPRDESYRHYADFQLSSDVRMINGVALSFALRAVDAQNYYLIQLTGAKADEPYVLRGFLVKNGVAQRLQPSIPIDGVAGTIKPNHFFNVSVTAVGNSFKVSTVDGETGDVFPLGVLTDPNRNFTIGAVGIAARDGEQNEVGTFTVCTPECPKGRY